MGPNVCKPVDGSAYDGCQAGSVSCAGNSCCLNTMSGYPGPDTDICFKPCLTSGDCGGGTCAAPPYAQSCNGGSNVCWAP